MSDGYRTYAVSNGHEYLGLITGSGCTLGTAVAAFLAIEREDKLLAVLAGLVVFELAAERAAKAEGVRGPGTFMARFIDEIYALRKETEEGETTWIKSARVEKMDV